MNIPARNSDAEESKRRPLERIAATRSPAQPPNNSPGRPARPKEMADRQPQHEERKGTSAPCRWVKIANERVRRRSASGLSYTDTQTRGKQRTITPRQSRSGRQKAPGCNAQAEQLRALPAIRQSTEGHADQRVQESEGGRQPTDLRVGQGPLLANGLDEGARDLAIGKVQEVDGKKNGQRPAG